MMSKSIDADLSRRERQIMQVIYAHEEVTVTEIVAALPDRPTETAVRTFLSNLQRKGHVQRRKDGRRFLYRPVASRRQAARNALNNVLGIFFDDSLSDAFATHLADPDTKLSETELQRLQELIEQARKEEA